MGPRIRIRGPTCFPQPNSISTEPYAEGVTWLMRHTAIELSDPQLRQLRAVMRRYSRDVQPLHGREIRYRHQ